ncbi:unnamed protein product [Caenorhabditis sp. 36 PRJEB53466]|nr:unnamed protein product [Caenorhabditis sp. 36 PRJEB53466]
MSFGHHPPNNNLYYYPEPSRHSSRSSHSQPPRTIFHGLVVGIAQDYSQHFLVYSIVFPDLVRVSNTVGDLNIGQWLILTVFVNNYQGEFVLDRSNSSGYENLETLPDPRYTSARFFPQRNVPWNGEVLVTARFDVKANNETGKFEYVSFDIHSDHWVDEYDLIKASGHFYEGRSFIIEAQVSLAGFIVVHVHEDPQKLLSCDALPNTIIPYDIAFLEDSGLMKIMTGTGYCPLEASSSKNVEAVNQHSTSYTPLQTTLNEFSSRSSSGMFTTRSKSGVTLSESEPELRNLASDVSDVTFTRAGSSNSKLSRNPAPEKPQETQKNTGGSEFLDNDINTTMVTIGTRNHPARNYIKNVAEGAIQRCRMERVLNDETSVALCVVVQKCEECAILFTLKSNVLNVLAMDSCQGLTGPLQLGDVVFFEISPRRSDTKDELLPKTTYSHIAVRLAPFTPKRQENITLFKESVRTFGGLLEMKVTIELNSRQNVNQFYDDDVTVNKSDDDRKYYFLTATNGALVSIPTNRLIHMLSANFTANFNLYAWAVHRKSVGNVSLHIGANGEAYQHYTDGTIRHLPISSDRSLMHVKK